MRKIAIALLFIIMCACGSTHHENKIILLYYDKNWNFIPKDTILLYNSNETIFAKIIMDDTKIVSSKSIEDSIFLFLGNTESPVISFFVKDSIRDYYIVEVGKSLKYINKTEPLGIFSYKKFFTDFYCYFTPQIGDIFYNEKHKKIKHIWVHEDELEYNVDDNWQRYYIKDVKGDWLEVNYLGWFKWKDENNITIDRLGIF